MIMTENFSDIEDIYVFVSNGRTHFIPLLKNGKILFNKDVFIEEIVSRDSAIEHFKEINALDQFMPIDIKNIPNEIKTEFNDFYSALFKTEEKSDEKPEILEEIADKEKLPLIPSIDNSKKEILEYMLSIGMDVKPLNKNKDPKEKLVQQLNEFLNQEIEFLNQEKPIEEKPIEEKPIEVKPIEEKPIEVKPIEEKPIEKKSIQKKSELPKPEPLPLSPKKEIKIEEYKVTTNNGIIIYISVDTEMGFFMAVKNFKSGAIKPYTFSSISEIKMWLQNQNIQLNFESISS